VTCCLADLMYRCRVIEENHEKILVMILEDYVAVNFHIVLKHRVVW
jgi:hypothetical protein